MTWANLLKLNGLSHEIILSICVICKSDLYKKAFCDVFVTLLLVAKYERTSMSQFYTLQRRGVGSKLQRFLNLRYWSIGGET